MREFYSQFREGLAKGLRPHRRTVRGVEALIECFNVKPTEAGLVPHSVSASISGTMDWPQPQLFNLEPCCGADSYIRVTDCTITDQDGNVVLNFCVDTYIGTVYVVDLDDGNAPINGANVTLTLPSTATLSDDTAGDGSIGFSGLVDASYPVAVTADGYQSGSGTLVISGSDNSVTIGLNQVVVGYTLTVHVENCDNGDDIENAEVVVVGEGTDYTDILGDVTFTLPNGTYTVNVEPGLFADCFDQTLYPSSDTVTISGGDATLTLYQGAAG